MPLEQEFALYQDHAEDWAVEHADEFVLIKDEEVCGFFSSYDDALGAGCKRFGFVDFFVHQVKTRDEEPVYYVPRGLMLCRTSSDE